MWIQGSYLRAFPLIAAILAAAGTGSPAIATSAVVSEPPAAKQTTAPVVLDRVIAVINGEVLLQSDLQSEEDMAALQPLSLPQGKNFDRRAAQRLINRVLILQQMKNQGITEQVSDEEVKKDLDMLRRQIPACVPYQCQTDAGWAKFLSDHHLTAEEVQTRWRQRMQILSFIDARFRAGLRISKAEIEDYYNKTFVPQFKKENPNPPSLESISSRIEEVLLQQHVSVLLRDWLKSLRDQGSVIILDPALGQSNPSPDADDDSGGAE
jgi:peptidyl-prolyl cis-trans isomerase SurA